MNNTSNHLELSSICIENALSELYLETATRSFFDNVISKDLSIRFDNVTSKNLSIRQSIHEYYFVSKGMGKPLNQYMAIAFNHHKKDELAFSCELRDTPNYIHLHDTKTMTPVKEVGTFGIGQNGKFFGVHGMDYHPTNDYLMVTDVGNDRLQLLDEDRKTIAHIKTASSLPDEIKFTPDGSFYVSEFYSWTESQVYLYDSRGSTREKINNLPLSSHAGLCFMARKHSPSSSQSDLLVVCNDTHNSIDFISRKETILTLSNLEQPSNACMDMDGYLNVSCQDHTVVILEPRKNFKQVSKIGVSGISGCSSKYLKFPTGLCVDGENRLYVVDQGNERIMVYEKRK